MVVHGSRMGKAPVAGALFWWLFEDKDKPAETDCAWRVSAGIQTATQAGHNKI